jgi:CDP-diacylglycerol--glycerol-3-phosphate 3-phosphatidyltransferase
MDIIDVIGVNMPDLTKEFSSTKNAQSRIRKSWFFLLILQILLLATGTLVLRTWWTDQNTIRWLGLATISSLVFLGILWRNLFINSRPGEDSLLPNFGPGNLLTIMRGLFLALLMGFLFSPWPSGWLAWIPGLLYSFIAIADLFDGYLARKFDHMTLLGEKLDLTLDGLGMLVASILLVQYGQAPAWYILVGLARYLFVAGIWMRRKMGKPVFDLISNPTRRPFAGAQMGFAAVVLYPFFGSPGTGLAAALFAVPFLVGFTIDWLQVSGVKPAAFLSRIVGPGRPAKNKNLEQQNEWLPSNILAIWLPLGLRVSLVILISIWVERNLISMISLENLTTPFFISNSTSHYLWGGWLLLIIGISTLMIALGAAGRIAALIILFGVGMYVNYYGLSISESLLVVGMGALLYLGTGPYSLWNPEHRLISRRLGEL